MSEDVFLRNAEALEESHRVRQHRINELTGELAGLEEGLPTFVAEVGERVLNRLADLMVADSSFTEDETAAVHQLFAQQERIEQVERELEALK